MWNAVQSNALGGKYDEKPGDRREVTNNPNQTFEPVKLEITVFAGKIEFKSIGGRLSSEKDSYIALEIERTIRQMFPEKKPKREESQQKKLDDGKTIDI